MPQASSGPLLDRIAAALGVSRETLEKAEREPLPADWLYVDGTPDQFEVWADQVVDPRDRQQLKKIAAALNRRKGGR